MGKSINAVIVSGHLVRDPELKVFPSGTKVCSMRVAVNDRVKDSSGTWVDRAIFIDVAAWEGVAETCKKYLAKGSLVIVDGKLRMEEWEDKETGKQRQKLSINARSVQLPPKGGGSRDPGSDGPPPDQENDDIPF